MKKLRPLGILTLALTLTISSIYGKDADYQNDETYSSAYAQSSRTAHWSVYIPIAILVGAAIWFGVADRTSNRHDSSSNSQDGLGSIANKRISHSNSSYNSYSSSYSSSYSNYSKYSRYRKASSSKASGSYSHSY